MNRNAYVPGTLRRLLPAVLVLALISALLLPGCGGGGKQGTSTPTSTGPRTGAPDGPSFSFIVCGDPQNNYEVFDRVLSAARSVDFLIIAGDLTGSGTDTEFENFVSHMDASGVKYYAVPGNHDIATQPLDQGYEVYIGPAYQSFDYKNCHFMLIDNCNPELGFYPAEQQWARQDLAAARKKKPNHIIAVAHVPPGFPYSAKASASQIPGLDNNDEMVPLLAEGGVEELFCGHVHTYMESTEEGVLVTITGGAGAPLLGVTSYNNYVQVDINGRQRTQKVVRI
jgi:predicted phosphodiesterase